MTESERGRGWWGVLPHVLGVGALVAGGLTVALWLVAAVILIGPLLFWLAWNELGFGPAIGLGELGFWPIVLATLFLVIGWFGKTVIAGIVFMVEPEWLSREALVHWPEPTLRNLVAVAILSMLAASPHARGHKSDKRRSRNHEARRPDPVDALV